MSDEIAGRGDARHDTFRRPDGEPARPEVRVAEPLQLTPGAPPAPRAPRPPMSTRTKRIFGAGIVVAVLAAAVPIALMSGDDDAPDARPTPTPTVAAVVSTGPADDFREAVSVAFDPLGGVLNVFLLTNLRAWKAGTATNAEVRAAFDNVLPGVLRARSELDAIASFEPAPNAKADYEGAILLYLQTTRLGLAATALPASPVQRQLRTQALRLQVLGDRVFDQAGRDLTGFLRQNPQVEAVTIQPPLEIPDFTARDLLAGAPLVPAPRATVDVIPPTGANQQAVEAWVAAVGAVPVPTAQEVAAAVTAATDGAALGALANRLTTAALAVRDLDDPASGRADSTRVQLSLLIAAEAARAAEAASLVTGAPREALLVVARTLAAQSDRMWDPRLAPRDSGFPTSLLTPA